MLLPITADMKLSIDKLVEKFREQADIDSNNPYVFALRRNSTSYIRGHEVLRGFSEDCGAAKPKLLKTANLRKHTATTSQILNFNEHEFDQLAQFMGHNIKIHQEFHRLLNGTV
jgi:hypothetical protein